MTSSYIHHSQFLTIADDTKCFHHISTLTDQNALQEDISAVFTWSQVGLGNIEIQYYNYCQQKDCDYC